MQYGGEGEELTAGYQTDKATVDGTGDTSGASSCGLCPLGLYDDDLASDTLCKPCPAGWFAGNYGATECMECELGKYSGEAAAQCNSCPDGHFTDLQSPSATEEDTCIKCPVGYFSSGSSTACTKCEVGKIAALEMQSECVDCTNDPGRYAPLPGMSECKACPGGYFANLTQDGSSCGSCLA